MRRKSDALQVFNGKIRRAAPFHHLCCEVLRGFNRWHRGEEAESPDQGIQRNHVSTSWNCSVPALTQSMVAHGLNSA